MEFRFGGFSPKRKDGFRGCKPAELQQWTILKKKFRIGILGGTFNPPHLGHLILAAEALRQLKLSKVVFIPAFVPPHKKVVRNEPLMRHKMTALAVEGNPFFETSLMELKRGAVSYSIDTLRALKKRYGKTGELFFIIGSDSLSGLMAWKRIREVTRLARFAVAVRPGFPARQIKRGMLKIKMPLVDISSSDIRNRVKKSDSVRYLVPENVREFIEKKGLYK